MRVLPSGTKEKLQDESEAGGPSAAAAPLSLFLHFG